MFFVRFIRIDLSPQSALMFPATDVNQFRESISCGREAVFIYYSTKSVERSNNCSCPPVYPEYAQNRAIDQR